MVIGDMNKKPRGIKVRIEMPANTTQGSPIIFVVTYQPPPEAG